MVSCCGVPIPCGRPTVESDGAKAEVNSSVSAEPCETRDDSQQRNAVVTLNIYDATLCRLVEVFNDVALALGGGAYHVGVEVHLQEWSFGQSDYGTGISSVRPRRHHSHRFRNSERIGFTRLTSRETSAVVAELADSWPGNKYHLFQKNCIHFAQAFCKRLGCSPVPSWVDSMCRSMLAVTLPLDRLLHKAFRKCPVGFGGTSDFVYSRTHDASRASSELMPESDHESRTRKDSCGPGRQRSTSFPRGSCLEADNGAVLERMLPAFEPARPPPRPGFPTPKGASCGSSSSSFAGRSGDYSGRSVSCPGFRSGGCSGPRLPSNKTRIPPTLIGDTPLFSRSWQGPLNVEDVCGRSSAKVESATDAAFAADAYRVGVDGGDAAFRAVASPDINVAAIAVASAGLRGCASTGVDGNALGDTTDSMRRNVSRTDVRITPAPVGSLLNDCRKAHEDPRLPPYDARDAWQLSSEYCPKPFASIVEPAPLVGRVRVSLMQPVCRHGSAPREKVSNI
eukprot:TRINITY_DN18168_c0_g1_i1.p1 TRINITY_DN18168_c0_g1~~TRINITY_DN18168_c0_g1_i1.p1  ORF type:complete len:509 (+),score=70.76 TRINITY_DN18168_c0_g1_i1:88-1614(+)